jgi:hypothetical protein
VAIIKLWMGRVAIIKSLPISPREGDSVPTDTVWDSEGFGHFGKETNFTLLPRLRTDVLRK